MPSGVAHQWGTDPASCRSAWDRVPPCQILLSMCEASGGLRAGAWLCYTLDACSVHPHAKAGVSGWGSRCPLSSASPLPLPWSTAFQQEPSAGTRGRRSEPSRSMTHPRKTTKKMTVRSRIWRRGMTAFNPWWDLLLSEMVHGMDQLQQGR